jgi:hypothetical protein
MPQIYAPPVAYKPEPGVGGGATLIGEPFYIYVRKFGTINRKLHRPISALYMRWVNPEKH